MSAGITLQLFPPQPKAPRRQVSNKRPSRPAITCPSPTSEKMESAKTPVDFHELIIRVESQPTSPVTVPAKAHIPKTPPQTSNATFESPPRAKTASPSASTARPRAASPAMSPPRAKMASPPAAAERKRVVSPSMSPSRTRVASPMSSEAQSTHSARVIPPTPDNKQKRAPTPALSDVQSARSGSPTLVRSNSVATTAQSPTSPGIPMRSIFPRFDPTLPLSQQRYRPTQVSPTFLPKTKISKPEYTPTVYSPHSNIEQEEAECHTPPTPYYTPATGLDSLWDVANGQGTPSVQVFTLQMHRPVSSSPDSSKASRISFGPTSSLPFYSLAQSPAPDNENGPQDHELLVRRHHPTKPTSIPVTHLSLTPPPAKSLAASTSQDNLQQESSILVTTIYPKLAAIMALDAAAQSPVASNIALVDPDATSPAAMRLAENVLRTAAERECCALAWTRDVSSPYSTSGTYQLHHPSLGVFPVETSGSTNLTVPPSDTPPAQRRKKAGSISLLNPLYVQHPENPAPAAGSSSTSDNAVLARLDFANDTLVLNVAAMLPFRNPYLIDVAATTLLSVAVAEERRARSAGPGIMFEPPPPPRAATKSSSASIKTASRTSTGYSDIKRPKGKRKWSLTGDGKSKHRPADLELGQRWPGSPSFERYDYEEKEELPWFTKSILSLLRVGFKTIIWILGMGFKVLSKLILGATHVVQRG